MPQKKLCYLLGPQKNFETNLHHCSILLIFDLLNSRYNSIKNNGDNDLMIVVNELVYLNSSKGTLFPTVDL